MSRLGAVAGPAGPAAPLDPAQLRAAVCGPVSTWRDVVVVARTGSTNADLAAAARRGEAGGLVLVAGYQRAGRGRRDRGWSSPPGAGLTFSVLLRPAGVPAGRWSWLPLLAGIAVADAVTAAAGVPARLKWPNDVLVEDRKVAGILAERVEDGPGAGGRDGGGGGAGAAVVVGVGINVSTSVADLPATATSLAVAGAPADRAGLLVAVLAAFDTGYAGWVAVAGEPDAGPDGGLRARYRARCATLGRRVRVDVGAGPPIGGRAVDVDPTGRLLVRTGTGEHALSAGDVVHVR